MIDVQKRDFQAKILIIGEAKVGKSSILMRFTDNYFNEHMMPTLGIDYKMKKLLVDGAEMKLQIWDTAGQERYRAITQNFYKGALGMALVFDLTDRASFKTIKTWLENIKTYAGDKVVKVIMANKCDMGEREVSEDEVMALANEVNLPYFMTSAKKDLNIKEAFECMARKIKKMYYTNGTESIFSESQVLKSEVKTLKEGDDKKKDDGCC